MFKKNYFIFDLLVFFLVIALCQSLYHMRTVADKPFFPTFVMIVKKDTTFTQKELSRFFLYLSNLLRPSTSSQEVPVLLTNLDTLSAQLARAHHAIQASTYSAEQKEQYQQKIAALLFDIEKTAHDYLKERTSTRLLTPNGLSQKITTDYEDAKKGLVLTQRTHMLFKVMQHEAIDNEKVSDKHSISSVEEGLKENEQLLQNLTA